MFKRGKGNVHDTVFNINSNIIVSLFSVTYVVGTHWNCLIVANPMCTNHICLAMSTSVLKALPGKLDIKRHSPSILYLYVRSNTALTKAKATSCNGNIQRQLYKRLDTCIKLVYTILSWCTTSNVHVYGIDTIFSAAF